MMIPAQFTSPTEDVVVVDVIATCGPSETVPGAYEGIVLEAANEFSTIFVGGDWQLTPSVRGWPKSDQDAEEFLWERFFSYDGGDPSWIAQVGYRFVIYDTNGDAVYSTGNVFATLRDTDQDSLPEDSDFSAVEVDCTLDPPKGTGVYSIIADYPAQTGGECEFSMQETSPWWIPEEEPEEDKLDSNTAIRIYWRQPPTAVEPATWSAIKSLYK
jgi:hypothetical protein